MRIKNPLKIKISVKEHASLFLGNNIWVTGGNTTIICNKNIMIMMIVYCLGIYY